MTHIYWARQLWQWGWGGVNADSNVGYTVHSKLKFPAMVSLLVTAERMRLPTCPNTPSVQAESGKAKQSWTRSENTNKELQQSGNLPKLSSRCCTLDTKMTPMREKKSIKSCWLIQKLKCQWKTKWNKGQMQTKRKKDLHILHFDNLIWEPEQR